MNTTHEDDRFYQALVERDAEYEGIFFVGVKTTGIFCRPTCSARKPKRENVEFFRAAKDALAAGYRSCEICKPLNPPEGTPPGIQSLLIEIGTADTANLSDAELKTRGLEPSAVRRWFLRHYGMTFHAYQRARRVNSAFKKIRRGASVTEAALDSGYDSLSGFADSCKSVTGLSPQGGKRHALIDLTRIETPLGAMFAGATDEGLCLLEFNGGRLEKEVRELEKHLGAKAVNGENRWFSALRQELAEYFTGKRHEFTLPLVTPGTDFQRLAWTALRRIPYGEAWSYRKEAEALGRPTAVRAVASANRQNRISIIIPCHRVLGADGQLTGYGGGLWRKKWLLDLERAHRMAGKESS